MDKIMDSFKLLVAIIFVSLVLCCLHEGYRDYKDMKKRFEKKDREKEKEKVKDKFSDYR